jgi:hypothetical protein
MLLKTIRLFLLISLFGMFAGCDELRSKIVDVIQPQTPQQTLLAVDDLIVNGNTKLAISKAEKIAETSGPLQGQFSWSLARAYALEGDLDKALKNLRTAIDKLNLTPADVLHEKAFESIQTNIRFMETITNVSGTQQSSSSSVNQVRNQTDANQTSIKMDSSGTEVRAGNIVLKLPN